MSSRIPFAVLLVASLCAAFSCSTRRATAPRDSESAVEPPARAGREPAEREEREPRQSPASAWFSQQRMSSGEPIPPRARERALEDRRRMIEARLRGGPGASGAASGTASGDAPGTWVGAGPINVGGRITALALDPNNSNRIWMGAAAGGVFHSTDSGATWTPVFDAQPLLPVGAIAAHPTNSSIVYVGTGEANGAGYSYPGDGVYKTSDEGATWTHLGLDLTARIGRIAINPSNPQQVFVAAAGNVYVQDNERGIYRSSDGGASWQQVLFVAATAGAIDVAIDPSNPSRIYAAIWENYGTDEDWIAGGPNCGIWRSLDGGTNWTRLTNGLPSGATVGRIGLAIAPSSPSTVYALYMNDPGFLMGVYKTTNSGGTWARVDPAGGPLQNFNGGYGYYFGNIRVDPANANIVYALDVYWAVSTNGGATWAVKTAGIHSDHHDLLITPGKLQMGTDGGFYTSVNAGTNWTKATTLPISQFYDLGIDPINPLKRFGGLQDNGSVRTTTGGLNNWTSVNGGDGFQCEVDPVDNLRVYCESQNGAIVRSVNGGNSFSGGTTGISGADRRNWNTPITHDPVTTQRLYIGTYRVYRSVNGAASWTSISPDLTNGPILHPPGPGGPDLEYDHSHLASVVEGTVTAIAVSRIDTNILWAGTDDGNVWVTTTQGGSWTQVDVPGRTEWVTRLEADPFDAQSAYATFSGFRNASRMPRIYRTTDLGNTWLDMSGDLPDVPLNCVNADPLWQGRVFACTDLGVYVTEDWGVTWSAMSTGMPPMVVHDLDLVSSTRTLFAGTHARSMLTYDLNQLPPPDKDLDGTINVHDCAPDDGGAFAVPVEVTGLLVSADLQTIVWSPPAPSTGSGTLNQLVRGVLAELPAGTGPSETCLLSAPSQFTATDPDLPDDGTGYWYLVRAKNSCGTGGYGTTSGGAPRLLTACS